MRPLAEEVDDPPAVRIGECRERPIEARQGHRSGSNLRPLALSISVLETSRTGCEKVQ
jgi:hypothetical protein